MTAYSPDVRRLLVHFAACEWDRPLPRVAVDWDEVLRAVRQHRLTGLAYYHLSRHDIGEFPPPSFRRAVNLWHYRSARHAVGQYRDFKALAGHLLGRDLEFMAVKGPVLAHTVYPAAAVRAIRDADLIIREGDRAAVHAALVEIGYGVTEGSFEYIPPLVPEVLPLRHTQYSRPGGHLPVEIHCDNFLLDDLVPRDLESIWQRAMVVDIEGVPVRTPAPEDHFLHLCAHVHQHRFSLLFWLSDLVLMLRRHGDGFDWDQLLRAVAVEEAQVPVYFTLRLMESLFGQTYPPGVVNAVRPDRVRRWCHERLIPQEKTMLLSGEDYPPLSFKSLPVFNSTLINLLVMSRRSAKIRFLIRLLIPTPEWLRQRYHLSPHQSVWPYYLRRLMPPNEAVER